MGVFIALLCIDPFWVSLDKVGGPQSALGPGILRRVGE